MSEVRRLYGIPEVNTQMLTAAGPKLTREVVQSLAPSQVPSFETHLRRKDGSLFPVRLHISTLRNREGRADWTRGCRAGPIYLVGAGRGNAHSSRPLP